MHCQLTINEHRESLAFLIFFSRPIPEDSQALTVVGNVVQREPVSVVGWDQGINNHSVVRLWA